jgi:hypothetical protein
MNTNKSSKEFLVRIDCYIKLLLKSLPKATPGEFNDFGYGEFG